MKKSIYHTFYVCVGLWAWSRLERMLQTQYENGRVGNDGGAHVRCQRDGRCVTMQLFSRYERVELDRYDFVFTAMTTPNKLWSVTIRLYGSNVNFQHTYIWCDNNTLLDPAIAGTSNLDFGSGSNVAMFFDAASPQITKLVSSTLGAGTPVLCED